VNKFIKEPEEIKELPQGVPVGGSFQCHTCSTQADEAQYYPNESKLAWMCPESHVSFIENFSLGV
jgi:hypothetical protein